MNNYTVVFLHKKALSELCSMPIEKGENVVYNKSAAPNRCSVLRSNNGVVSALDAEWLTQRQKVQRTFVLHGRSTRQSIIRKEF